MALIGIAVLVSVGVAGMLAENGAGTPVAAAPAPPPAPAQVATGPEPPAVELTAVSLVDVETGRASPLPSRIRSVPGAGPFRVSPDGSRIAFDDGGTIFVARVDGSHLRRFEPETGTTAPNWSPDGRTLVFGAGDSIFTLDLASRAFTRVLDERGAIWNPNFSADGRTILYTAIGRRRLVMRTVPAGGGPRSFVRRGAFGVYSPDGRSIAFRRTIYNGTDVTRMTSGSMWIAGADGSHARALGHQSGWMSQIDPEALWPAWSPDGTAIAYRSLYNAPVTVIEVRTGRGRRVGEGSDDPSWLNDQTLIVEGYRRER